MFSSGGGSIRIQFLIRMGRRDQHCHSVVGDLVGRLFSNQAGEPSKGEDPGRENLSQKLSHSPPELTLLRHPLPCGHSHLKQKSHRIFSLYDPVQLTQRIQKYHEL